MCERRKRRKIDNEEPVVLNKLIIFKTLIVLSTRVYIEEQ